MLHAFIRPLCFQAKYAFINDVPLKLCLMTVERTYAKCRTVPNYLEDLSSVTLMYEKYLHPVFLGLSASNYVKNS